MHSFSVSTKGFTDVIDITEHVQQAVPAGGEGLLTVFISGSTAGITTIEFEPGVVDDFKQAIERLIPRDIKYQHDAKWGDGNGFAHVRAALLGPSLNVPYKDGQLSLGTWQQVVLVDFDNRPRQRTVTVQLAQSAD